MKYQHQESWTCHTRKHRLLRWSSLSSPRKRDAVTNDWSQNTANSPEIYSKFLTLTLKFHKNISFWPIFKLFQLLLQMWSNELNSLTPAEKASTKAKLTRATFTQTQIYLKPLFRRLESKNKKLPEDILDSLTIITKHLLDRNYIMVSGWSQVQGDPRILQPWLQTNETAHVYAQNLSKLVETIVGVYLTRRTRARRSETGSYCVGKTCGDQQVREWILRAKNMRYLLNIIIEQCRTRVWNAFEIEYPERPAPNRSTIMWLTKKFEETGSVSRRQYHWDCWYCSMQRHITVCL